MSLTSGSRIGSYEISGLLGVGGMGEVYRGRDTKLNRDVAIKVLPAVFADDVERLARFRREAQILASLNHPSIAAIYGLEESEGKVALAMELVPGEDLADRLNRGPIAVDDALAIAIQIAEALEEAHNKGIVHRDLKPGNVRLTPDGKVKVLDFGLAKAWSGDAGAGSSSSVALSKSPTIANAGTMAGVILGTAAYMSPEQARGRAVDKRADIWSFGVLLWEMLTGRALFAGDTVTDVIAAVVTQEPDLDTLPAATPRAVRRLLGRCLRKDPRTRLPDIGAARLELQDVLSGTTAELEAPAADVEGAARAEHRSRARERWVWAGVALVLAGLAVFLILRHLTTAPEVRPVMHFVLDTPDDMTFGDFNPPAPSPDGRYVVFAGFTRTGTGQLWLRPLDSPEARALLGTEGAEKPFWSADSASVAFFAGGEIKKLILAGGTVQRVCPLPGSGFEGGTWNNDGTIVFSTGGDRASLYSVSAAGGEAKPLMVHDKSRGETSHWSPQFLPDGRHLLFAVGSAKEDNAGLYVTSLEAPGERRRVLPNVGRFLYALPGHLLFVRDGILLAQRFDARRMVMAGEAVPIASTVAGFSVDPNWGLFSTSDSGLVAWISGVRSDVRLEWIDRNGKRLGPLGDPANYGQIALSPDGRRVAVEIADSQKQWDIWVIDVARGVASRVTATPANERDPVWSPDSQELVFLSDEGGDPNLLRKNLQGDEPASPLPGGIGRTPGERDVAESWPREGNTLIFSTQGQQSTIWAVSLEGGGPPEPLMKSRFLLDEPQLSPDGRSLAYISNESGRYEVYIEPFRRRGNKVRVSAAGGGQPKWRGDGKELFYLSLDGRLMAVNVRAGTPEPEVGIPTELVQTHDLRAVVEGPDYDDYAVSADGQRFLVKVAATKDERQRIHVLLNWPSLVK